MDKTSICLDECMKRINEIGRDGCKHHKSSFDEMLLNFFSDLQRNDVMIDAFRIFNAFS